MTFIEARGIEPVPAGSRTQGSFTLFVMFAGINICLPMMMVGGILVPSLSLREAVLVGLLGNLAAGVLISLCALPGVRHGLPAAVLSRLFLGPRWGTMAASLAIVFSLVGWFAVQAELAGLAADGLLRSFSGASSPLLLIFFMGAANVLFAVAGFDWMKKLAAWSVPALLVLALLLAHRILATHPWAEFWNRPGTGGMTLLQGLNLMISGQVGGAFTASDLARYGRDHGSVWTGVLLGVAPVATLMITLGALSALSSGEWNPVLGVEALGMGAGSLLLIILATWTTNDKNLYSGGLALTNVFPGIPRWRHTLLLGALGTLLACLRITRYFSQWLIALGAVFAPLVGLLLAEYYANRRGRLPEDLNHPRGSGPTRLSLALPALGLGVLLGRLSPPHWIQPLVSITVTALTYLLACRLLGDPKGEEGA